MWKYSLYLMAFLATVMNLSGCGSDEIQVHLNEEFSLSVGQYGVVSGENLKIKFKEVTEDSRCPKDVTCVWAGRATCMIELIQSELSNRMMLTEPGLTVEYSKDTYEEYELMFRVTPYPEAGKQIPMDAYRLHLIVSKLHPLTKILGFVIAAPLSYEGKSITVVGYYRGWDLLHEINISPPITRSDWVVKDPTGAIYVSANSEVELPEGLLPSSLEVVDTIIEIKGVVRVTKGGQPYIDATSIERIP
ncbi:MAG: hypothetical protein PHN78_00460 [Dehalococcoidales bacterium]|nr:hypothetical protein [Dehalococcoidales bacterium]